MGDLTEGRATGPMAAARDEAICQMGAILHEDVGGKASWCQICLILHARCARMSSDEGPCMPRAERLSEGAVRLGRLCAMWGLMRALGRLLGKASALPSRMGPPRLRARERRICRAWHFASDLPAAIPGSPATMPDSSQSHPGSMRVADAGRAPRPRLRELWSSRPPKLLLANDLPPAYHTVRIARLLSANRHAGPSQAAHARDRRHEDSERACRRSRHRPVLKHPRRFRWLKRSTSRA